MEDPEEPEDLQEAKAAGLVRGPTSSRAEAPCVCRFRSVRARNRGSARQFDPTVANTSCRAEFCQHFRSLVPNWGIDELSRKQFRALSIELTFYTKCLFAWRQDTAAECAATQTVAQCLARTSFRHIVGHVIQHDALPHPLRISPRDVKPV